MRRVKKNDVPEKHESGVALADIESTEGADSAPEPTVPTVGSLLGTAVVVAILVAAIAIAFTLNREARQLPLVVAFPTLAMAGYILVRDIMRYRRADRAGSTSAMKATEQKVPAEGTEDGAKGLSEAKTFAVFAAFILLYLALGFPWGASIFLLLFLLIIGKVGIIKSLLTTILVVVPFYVVFVMFFRIPNFSGFLLS